MSSSSGAFTVIRHSSPPPDRLPDAGIADDASDSSHSTMISLETFHAVLASYDEATIALAARDGWFHHMLQRCYQYEEGKPYADKFVHTVVSKGFGYAKTDMSRRRRTDVRVRPERKSKEEKRKEKEREEMKAEKAEEEREEMKERVKKNQERIREALIDYIANQPMVGELRRRVESLRLLSRDGA